MTSSESRVSWRDLKRAGKVRIALITVAVVVASIVMIQWTSASSGPSDAADQAVGSAGDDAESTAPDTGDSSAPDSPPSSPSSPATTGEGTPLDDTAARALVLTAVTSSAQADPAVPAADSLEGIATGAYVAEVDAQLQELDANGWTIEGEPTIEAAEVTAIALDAEPPSTTVETCIDSTEVRTIDSAGAPLPGASSPRALNIFHLQWDGARWLIADRTFPDDPAC